LYKQSFCCLARITGERWQLYRRMAWSHLAWFDAHVYVLPSNVYL